MGALLDLAPYLWPESVQGRQPQQPATSDRSASLARGLVGLWVPMGGALVSMLPEVPSGTVSTGGAIRPDLAALAIGPATVAAESAVIPYSAAYRPTGAITVLTEGMLSGSGTGYPLGCQNSLDGFGCYNNGARVYCRIGSAWADRLTGISAPFDGQVGFSFDGTTFWSIAAGLRVNSQSISGSITHSTVGLAINAQRPGNVTPSSAKLRYLAIWSRALLPAELAALSDNPWQLFAPQSLAVQVGAAATGTVTVPTATSDESDAAQALPAVLQCAAGVAAEADAAAALTALQVRVAGLAAETDAALAPGRAQLRAAGLSQEADAALALSASQSSSVQAGLALESDTALPLGRQVAGGHRYWRLLCTAVPLWNGAPYVALAEIELRESSGGADVTGAGAASASSALLYGAQAYTAGRAFDNSTDIDSIWHSDGSALPQWIAYDFGAGNTRAIREVVITPRDIVDQAPTSFAVQWSDDGSAWTTERSFDYASWVPSQPTVFSLMPSVPLPIGLALEVDAALPLPRVVSLPAGLSSEIATALAPARRVLRIAGLALEIEAALPLRVAGRLLTPTVVLRASRRQVTLRPDGRVISLRQGR